MSNLSNKIFSLITVELFFISAGLFIFGLFLSIYVVKKRIKWLCWYPEWIWNKLKAFLGNKPAYTELFLLIFVLNSVSLFFNLVSGFGIVLPIIFAILIGMNVGIIGYKEGGIKALLLMFFAPHALFELPAAWLSIALGIRLGLEMIAVNCGIKLIFSKILFIYLYVILPLLFLAALVESAFIYASSKQLQHSASLPQEPFEAEEKNNQNQ